MNWIDIATTVAVVAVAAIVAMVFWKRFRVVALETIKHPLRTTEIKLDKEGKVVEIKVSDRLHVKDKAAVD